MKDERGRATFKHCENKVYIGAIESHQLDALTRNSAITIGKCLIFEEAGNREHDVCFVEVKKGERKGDKPIRFDEILSN